MRTRILAACVATAFLATALEALRKEADLKAKDLVIQTPLGPGA